MALFRHPHLVRGVVHTHHGAFIVVRGLVDLPEEAGDSLGWRRLEETTAPSQSEPQTTAAASVPRRVAFDAR